MTLTMTMTMTMILILILIMIMMMMMMMMMMIMMMIMIKDLYSAETYYKTVACYTQLPSTRKKTKKEEFQYLNLCLFYK